MGDPMAPSGSEGERHEQAGRLGRHWRPWNERKDTNTPRTRLALTQNPAVGFLITMYSSPTCRMWPAASSA